MGSDITSLEEFKLYLPKYLSPSAQKELFGQLKAWPPNIDSRFYTSRILDDRMIFQGDGISSLPIVNPERLAIKNADGLILSNTCDIDLTNQRPFTSRILYAPIISLKRWSELLSETLAPEGMENHLEDLRRQRVTQIFFLPKGKGLIEDSLVVFDQIVSYPNSKIPRDSLEGTRLFTLSDYGFYMFVFKLSIHFTRMNEGISRN